MSAEKWFKRLKDIEGTPQYDQILHVAQAYKVSEKAWKSYQSYMERWLDYIYKFGISHKESEKGKETMPKTMTVKELYEYCVKHGAENYEILHYEWDAEEVFEIGTSEYSPARVEINDEEKRVLV